MHFGVNRHLLEFDIICVYYTSKAYIVIIIIDSNQNEFSRNSELIKLITWKSGPYRGQTVTLYYTVLCYYVIVVIIVIPKRFLSTYYYFYSIIRTQVPFTLPCSFMKYLANILIGIYGMTIIMYAALETVLLYRVFRENVTGVELKTVCCMINSTQSITI